MCIDELFFRIVNFIKSHEDSSSRYGLSYEKYKDWGSFVRSFDSSITDEICPRKLDLSITCGELKLSKPIYKKCVICDNCKSNHASSYNGLIDLYLYYKYWFWLDIIDSNTFIKIIEEKKEKNGRF